MKLIRPPSSRKDRKVSYSGVVWSGRGKIVPLYRSLLAWFQRLVWKSTHTCTRCTNNAVSWCSRLLPTGSQPFGIELPFRGVCTYFIDLVWGLYPVTFNFGEFQLDPFEIKKNVKIVSFYQSMWPWYGKEIWQITTKRGSGLFQGHTWLGFGSIDIPAGWCIIWTHNL